MGSLLQDIRYGVRTLAKSPGFTLVAVLTLALGIGANTAIFSAVNALLLSPYPFPQPDRILWVEARHVSGNNSGTGYTDFTDWRQQNVVFEEMAIVPWEGAYTLTGQGEPQRIEGGTTTEGFLRVLGVQPVLGRFFTAEENKPGGPHVAVLSYAAWQQRFAGNSEVLGRTMALDGQAYTIIGVLPSGFAFPGIRTCEFLAPLGDQMGVGRFVHMYDVIARLKPGVTVERAQADMTTIAGRLAQEYPESNKGWGVAVMPIGRAIAEQTQMPILVLFAAVAFVLLLACVNVAGLLLARASGRAKEIAIRASLGASRGRIVRQMLTESVLLAVAGGSLGLLFAEWLMGVLRAAAPAEMALDATLGLNTDVLAFTLALSLLTGILFGLTPAWHGSKTDLNAALKGDANAWSGARSRRRILSSLVAGEVALSLVLLVGAGLLVKDLIFVLRLDTGLRIEHVLTFALDPPYAKYSTSPRITAFYQELLANLRTAPGVDAAAAVMTLPMTGGMTGGKLEIEGRPKPEDWQATLVQYNTSTPGFFRAMGIPVVRGRDFDERDTAAALPVAVINHTLARQFFPHEDPIGHRFKDEYDGHWRTIVGVVGSYKSQQPMKPPMPGVYRPHAQSPASVMWVALRTTGDPAKLAAIVRGQVQTLDRDVPILKLRTMRQVVSDSVSQSRLMTAFLAGFAGFALVLAAIGIYGITAYSVTQRLHEIGIRVALGASRRDVFELVVSRGALLAGAGVAVGIPAALAITRFIGSLLYGVSPRDVTVFISIPAVLVLVTLAASYIPGRRAAKVDPMVALRYE
ncbi:MAG TPA: ABC transporter permease [Terriglobia bacterium]|nr:ABC transporter permease [Terriglobia bacterium]